MKPPEPEIWPAVCSEKLKMLRACLPSGLQELKLDLRQSPEPDAHRLPDPSAPMRCCRRETELNNQDIITFAAGLPRELEAACQPT